MDKKYLILFGILIAVMSSLLTILIINFIGKDKDEEELPKDNVSEEITIEDIVINVVNAAEIYYQEELQNGITIGTIDLSKDTFKYSGEKPTKGYIEFDSEGNASSKMYVNGYCVTYNLDNTLSSEKINEEECDTTFDIKYTTYANGTAVYFNPTTGFVCSKEEAVSTTGTKSGCMKFYTFLDNDTSNIVKLLLDHNTTDVIEWNESGSILYPTTANSQLAKDTNGWIEVIDGKSYPLFTRMINVDELNEIAPPNENHKWDKYDSSSGYVFHTGRNEIYKGNSGTNKYDWLFDNTYNCTIYGCNVGVDEKIYGYWTYDTTHNGTAWGVFYAGNLNNGMVYDWYFLGVRPVITVSKEVLE